MYRLAADAMMADIVPVDRRMDAYSILRMGNNLGVALGPAIGGYLSAISYDISFSTAGIGIFAIGLAVAIFSLETLPAVRSVPSVSPPSGGYTRIVQDSKFMGLVGS